MIKLSKQVLYKYSIEEDIANGISHCIGAFLSYIGLIYLVYVSSTRGTIIDVIAFSIYGTSLIFLFLMSTLYHSIFHDTTRSIFKRLDHSAIFLLIAGTYVPFTFSLIKTPLSYIILAILYVISIAGIVLKVRFIGRYKKIGVLLYVFMGWLIVFEIKPLIDVLNPQALFYLVLGGVIYTVGSVIYAFSNFKYHHLIWHILVLLAAACHFIAVANYILV